MCFITVVGLHYNNQSNIKKIMNTLENILLKTAFSCMASDGQIDNKEISVIKNLCINSELFNDVDLSKSINTLFKTINKDSKQFILNYFNELSVGSFNIHEQLLIIDFALKTINADDKVEYSEIKFFKNIRHRLTISDQEILAVYPDIEFYLEKDINTSSSIDMLTEQYFSSIEIPIFELLDIDLNDL